MPESLLKYLKFKGEKKIGFCNKFKCKPNVVISDQDIQATGDCL